MKYWEKADGREFGCDWDGAEERSLWVRSLRTRLEKRRFRALRDHAGQNWSVTELWEALWPQNRARTSRLTNRLVLEP